MTKKSVSKRWIPLLIFFLLLTSTINFILVWLISRLVSLNGFWLYFSLILGGIILFWLFTMLTSILFGLIVKTLKFPAKSGDIFGVICWLNGIFQFIAYLKLDTPIISKILIELMIIGFWWNLSQIGFAINEKFEAKTPA